MQTLNCTIVHLRLFKSAKIDGVMDEILQHLLKKGEKSSKLIIVDLDHLKRDVTLLRPHITLKRPIFLNLWNKPTFFGLDNLYVNESKKRPALS